MKSLFLFLFVYSLLTYTAFAVPSETDRQEALKMLYTVSNGQEQSFFETSNYESTTPQMIGDLVVQSCAYSTLAGKGHIDTVSKVEAGKVYIIQRHTGDANPVIHERWTCTNCTGENYNMIIPTNEHGLCSIKEN